MAVMKPFTPLYDPIATLMGNVEDQEVRRSAMYSGNELEGTNAHFNAALKWQTMFQDRQVPPEPSGASGSSGPDTTGPGDSSFSLGSATSTERWHQVLSRGLIRSAGVLVPGPYDSSRSSTEPRANSPP
jgi:hypothetical protein